MRSQVKMASINNYLKEHNLLLNQVKTNIVQFEPKKARTSDNAQFPTN